MQAFTKNCLHLRKQYKFKCNCFITHHEYVASKKNSKNSTNLKQCVFLSFVSLIGYSTGAINLQYCGVKFDSLKI